MQQLGRTEVKEASGEYERNVSVKSDSYYINLPKPWAKAKKLNSKTKLKIITYDTHIEVWVKEEPQ